MGRGTSVDIVRSSRYAVTFRGSSVSSWLAEEVLASEEAFCCVEF